MKRLFLASATALFLELACIRWLGGHVLYLSYVSNFVLLVAFLGIGAGCLVAVRRPDAARVLAAALPAILLALVAAVCFLEVEVVIDAPGAIYFHNETHGGSLVVLPLLGALTCGVFASAGAAIGRELGTKAPLRAYTVDISGSLAGIALFTILSFARVPAAVWFSLAGLAWLPLLPRRRAVIYGAAACVLATSALVTWADAGSTWSPYYRVTLLPAGPDAWRIKVNDVTHQYLKELRGREPFYEFPYRARAGLAGRDWLVAGGAPVAHVGRVLVVGAGTGTDVAFALAYGASHVDAVEIDPLLAEIGEAKNPDRPYQDPRVALHITDARHFLEQASGPYDLIVFGLPDSLTLASPYAGLRLESFLFTRECFARARGLLSTDGLLVLYNYYREPWLVARLGATLAAAFDAPPRILVGPDRNLSAGYFAGPGLAGIPPELGAEWGFRWSAPDAHAEIPTDDWPFPYLKTRAIPSHLVFAMIGLLAAALILVGLVLGRDARAAAFGEAPFFLMGVAFLLLETSGLVRMSLLFGTTWLVNALAIFAVLVMVLIANALGGRLRVGPRALFVVLAAALVVAWAIPPARLANLATVPRYAAAALLSFAPIFLANLLFARLYRDRPRPALAFGVNLVGAVCGGALEYASLVVGYRALFLVALGLYALASLTVRATPSSS